MSRRTLRHPFRGERTFARPATRAPRPRGARVRQPRMRPRRQVHPTAAMAAPEEHAGRPTLRLKVVGAVVLALFGVMVFRLWALQVVDNKAYAAAVNSNSIRTVTTPAPRGDIVDRSDNALVDNASEQDIVLSATERADLEPAGKNGKLTARQTKTIATFATLVNETPGEVEKTIDDKAIGPYQQVTLLSDAPTTTVDFLEDNGTTYPGLSVSSATERSYPQGGTVATQVLGYTVTSPKAGQQYLQVGGSGLEQEYNKALTGKPGKQELHVNASGAVQSTTTLRKATQGDTLVTNLDTGLQETVQNALTSVIGLDRSQGAPASNGAAVVMNVNNGQVLAMASYPTYDNNEWVGGISEANYQALQAPCQTTSADASCPLDNFAIQGLYTPGSTFKLITATAALNTGLITPSYGFDDSTGSYTIPDCTGECTFYDDESAAGGPDVTVADALTISDDDFFYNLGVMFWDERATYGDTPIQDTAHDYSEGAGTGIDLPNASTGQIDSPEVEKKVYGNDTWTAGDNLELAFGQGATVITPIEEADAYATFANGGTRYQPEVGSAIVSSADKVVKEIEPKVTGHVTMSAANHAAILQGLEGVINSPSGTAYGTFEQDATPQALALDLAGKTGTADVASAGEQPNAWFASFGPNPDPQYVVVIVVANAGYGDAAAAPAAAQIWNYLAANPVPAVTLPSASHPVSEAAVPTPTTTTTTTTPAG